MENFGIFESSFSNKALTLATMMEPLSDSLTSPAVGLANELLTPVETYCLFSVDDLESSFISIEGTKKLKKKQSQITFMSPTIVVTAESPRKIKLLAKHSKGF